jgi:hypothetical protein
MRVEALGPNKSAPDLESASELVSNLKGPENIIIVYDASGSMLWPSTPGGEPRFRNAHRALSKYVNGIREKHSVGLMVYGSRYPSGIFDGKIYNLQAAAKSCTEDIVLTVPLGKLDKNTFNSELVRLSQSKSYKGDTPIGGSIAKASEILKRNPGERKHIILITDGAEECFSSDRGKGIPNSISPEAAVRMATENGIVVSIVAYGVGLGKDGKKISNTEQSLLSLQKLATGVFVIANTGEELTRALMQVDVENYKFDLLDVNNKSVARFSLRETFKVDTTPYASKIKLLKKKMKFSISAKGGQSFKKDIGIDEDMKDVALFLRLKRPDDSDPDIEPPQLRWSD